MKLVQKECSCRREKMTPSIKICLRKKVNIKGACHRGLIFPDWEWDKHHGRQLRLLHLQGIEGNASGHGDTQKRKNSKEQHQLNRIKKGHSSRNRGETGRNGPGSRMPNKRSLTVVTQTCALIANYSQVPGDQENVPRLR